MAGKTGAWTTYNYCCNNPINKYDPDGNAAHVVAGAIIGMALDYTLQVITNVAKGDNLAEATSHVDGKSVILSGVAGAAGVGLVSKVKQVGKAMKLGKAALSVVEASSEAVASGVESVAKQFVSEGTVSLKEAAFDAGIGAIASGAGSVGKEAMLSRGSGKLKVLENNLDRAQRLATPGARAARHDAVKKLTNSIETYGDGAAIATETLTKFSTGFIYNMHSKDEDKNDELGI